VRCLIEGNVAAGFPSTFLLSKHSEVSRHPSLYFLLTPEVFMISLTINGKTVSVDAEPDTPLLWVLRDTLQLTGTKYGCGQALCGACTVHLDGSPVRSCSLPVSAAAGRKITTIEAVDAERVGKAVQAAWRKLDVVQCGYCQSGQIMSAVALLTQNRKPSDADIDNAMAGNLCRCATYQRIRAAIHEAAKSLA
jgi:isoquinoline 1-oxidoreductase alpha subunit